MPMASDKVMFEIYQEAGYGRRFRVVYFTELDEHNKESEINRAMAGEHVYDGYLAVAQLDAAKALVDTWLRRWNAGEKPDAAEFEAALAAYAPPA